MNKSIIRTDRWELNPDKATHQTFVLTVDEYRAFCKALSFVVMGHWVEICAASSPCQMVEQLIHKTESNPCPKYYKTLIKL